MNNFFIFFTIAAVTTQICSCFGSVSEERRNSLSVSAGFWTLLAIISAFWK